MSHYVSNISEKKMKKISKIMFVSMVVFLFLPGAKAVPLTVDGGWTYFQFPGAQNGSDPYYWFSNFEFDLTQNAIVTVTDVYATTDQFEVYDNGFYKFTTSDPEGGPDYGLSPDEASLSPYYSHGSFLLEPGHHDIIGTNIRHLSTDFGGGAYIRVDTVSEPATLLLMLSGILLFLLTYRTNTLST